MPNVIIASKIVGKCLCGNKQFDVEHAIERNLTESLSYVLRKYLCRQIANTHESAMEFDSLEAAQNALEQLAADRSNRTIRVILISRGLNGGLIGHTLKRVQHGKSDPKWHLHKYLNGCGVATKGIAILDRLRDANAAMDMLETVNMDHGPCYECGELVAAQDAYYTRHGKVYCEKCYDELWVSLDSL